MQRLNERTQTQTRSEAPSGVRGIVRSAKELHSGLIPFISPQRGIFPTETGFKPSARINSVENSREVKKIPV